MQVGPLALFPRLATRSRHLNCHIALCIEIGEFKSFLLQNPVTLLIRIQKRSNLFKMMQIHKIFVPNIFLYQIKWIFLDLFAKNMNGWSDNSEILCVEQWGRAGKKTRKQQFYPGSRSWCKYFPNSFTTIFIWKNCEIFVASPWVFLMSHSTRP